MRKHQVLFFLLAWSGAALGLRGAADSNPDVILVVGAGGTPEYAQEFAGWAVRWEKAAIQASANLSSVGVDDEPGQNDKSRLKAILQRVPKGAGAPLWLVLLGHGTFDGEQSKFNLRGPDMTAEELRGWLAPFQRPVVVIDTSSASAPFLDTLSATNRVVITATQSGYELNFARFGEYLSQTVQDLSADLDKDGQVSILEAFLSAARQVEEFYQLNGRLASEHALIDDNGDKKGTPADWYRGVRVVKKAENDRVADGRIALRTPLIQSEEERKMAAPTRARRDQLETQVYDLRDQKKSIPEETYYKRLEGLMVQLAELYEGLKDSPRKQDP